MGRWFNPRRQLFNRIENELTRLIICSPSVYPPPKILTGTGQGEAQVHEIPFFDHRILRSLANYRQARI